MRQLTKEDFQVTGEKEAQSEWLILFPKIGLRETVATDLLSTSELHESPLIFSQRYSCSDFLKYENNESKVSL